MRQRRLFLAVALVFSGLISISPQAHGVDGDNAVVDRYGSFNGTTTYAATSGRVIPTGDFTIEAWFRPDAWNSRSDNFMVIASQAQNSGGCFTERFFFGLHRDTANNRYQVHTASGLCDNTRPNRLPNVTVPAEEWSHLAVIFNKSNSIFQTLLNGVVIDTFNGTLADISDDLFVLGATDAPNRMHYFMGRIDQVKIWQGALTVEEVNVSKGVISTSDSINNNLIALYDFNEATSNFTLNDRSPVSPNLSMDASNMLLTAKTVPTLSWSNVSKTFGDSNYTVTAPTVGNSIAGTFSYSSSNASVLAISGNTFTVGNSGSATVTAKFSPTDFNTYSWVTATQTVTVNKATQSITLASLGTSAKTYPYSQALAMSTNGSSGSGAITYAITAGGSATACQLSNSTSSATISATSSGTCLISATIASDSNYLNATSASLAFTFNQGSQALISVNATSGSYGTPVRLQASGGSGSGGITYAVISGGSATGCLVSNIDSLTSTSSGTCKVRATKAADQNYLAAISADEIINIVSGTTSALMTLGSGNIYYRESKSITVISTVAGKLTFYANNRVIANCRNLKVGLNNSFTQICSYRPSTRGRLKLVANFTPSDISYTGTSVAISNLFIYQRNNLR